MRAYFHAEKDMILSLKLNKNRNKVGLEQARDMGGNEAVEANEIGLKSLEFFDYNQTLLAHLLLPPPY